MKKDVLTQTQTQAQTQTQTPTETRVQTQTQGSRTHGRARMQKCRECGAYTFAAVHCGRATVSAHPAPFKISILSYLVK